MIAEALRRAYRRIAFGGRNRTCPLCGRSARVFRSAGVVPRRNAVCPWCGSLERHRLAWLHLMRTELWQPRRCRVLHFSPERSLALAFGRVDGLDRVTLDLEPAGVDVAADAVALPFPDASFDLVLCSHVLEHVVDDRAAMSELRRVIRPKGVVLVQVPMHEEPTFEDPCVTTPQGRLAAFGQRDHVRVYGLDIVQRLERAAFHVEPVTAPDFLEPDEIRRFALDTDEILLHCSVHA